MHAGYAKADNLWNRTPVGGRAEVLPVEFENGNVVGLAEARGTLGHHLQHGLQLGRRGADDPQNLGCRRLLFERLGEFLFQIGVGYAKGVSVSSRLRSGRTRLAVACWALCAFERQGHLVGTATGPPSGRPSQGSSLSILTEPHDELVPIHSITSSANASNLSGISRPSAFAVLRLITKSNFVDCWTGNSAGFSPLRMRPA